MRRVLDPMFVYFDSGHHWAPQHGLAMMVLSTMAYFTDNSGTSRSIISAKNTGGEINYWEFVVMF